MRRAYIQDSARHFGALKVDIGEISTGEVSVCQIGVLEVDKTQI